MMISKNFRLLIIVLVLSTNFAKAQNWGGGIDEERFNWGFNFQYISSQYRIWKTTDWQQRFLSPTTGAYVTDSLTGILSDATPGFAIGFVANQKISSHVDIRLTPSLAFSDNKVLYIYKTQPEIEKKVQSTMIELPLSLKLKSDRLMNFRAYMLGGVKYSMSMASKKKFLEDLDFADLDKTLKNKKNYLSYEAGVGFDLYFEYFKMSPEIKVSYSFKDMVYKDFSPFSTPIDRAKLRRFTFSLFFE